MKIVESDFYIEYNDGVYQLYLLKNKKELKEDDKNTHKISGYFLNLDSAFKEVIRFRQGKKYIFKQDWKSPKLLLNKYLKHKQSFQKNLTNIYKAITKLRRELFIYE